MTADMRETIVLRCDGRGEQPPSMEFRPRRTPWIDDEMSDGHSGRADQSFSIHDLRRVFLVCIETLSVDLPRPIAQLLRTCPETVAALDELFATRNAGVAMPYGVYDLLANRGWVFVGRSADTPAWKYHLQHALCSPHSLQVTVAHYPSGSSKWNPTEHRVFSEISKSWAAGPLDSFATILRSIRTTVPKTGLRMSAQLVD